MVDGFLEHLASYRAKTYRLSPGLRVKSPSEALEFVNERGFIFFWPVKGALLPSLWVAAAGDRPVADAHDDPGHVTWGWKDGALGQRIWYYGRLLRRRNTILSMGMAPNFYALSPNYGDYELDYLEHYRLGLMTSESKNIYEAILQNGPLDTIALRKASRMSSQSSDARFTRALDDLIVEMKVMPIGVSQAGAWHYSFIYELVGRYLPGLVEQSRYINESDARIKILETYFLSVGAARKSEVVHLFQWKHDQLEAALQKLTTTGCIQTIVLNQERENWLALPELF